MQKNKLNWKLYAVVFFIIALALLHHYGTTYTGFAASAPEKNVAVEANITTGKTNSTILPTASTSTTSSNEEEQAFTILAGESSGNQITSFALPLVENVTLNATSPQNLTSDNLTLHFDVFDADGDSVKNITDWRLWNGTDFESIAVLNMPFENHSSASSTAIDYSTFGNNGTVVSAVFNATGGKDGKGAYTFTSSGNQIIVPDSSELSFGNGTQDFPFTITAWINAKSTSGNPIISKYSSGEPGVPTNAEYVLQLAAGKLFLHLFNGGSISANIGAEGSSTLSTNQWYFIAASYDGSSLPNGIKLYVNGVEESVTTSSAGSYVAMNNTSQNVTIGRLFSGSESTFNGEIDGLQVFHLNLSGKQIQTLYENRTNLIINEETSIDETWQACVTPNDGFSDGT
ncbi:LamG domain-containing protein, partial [Candidatus Woesearchaeota archaeon]